MENEKKKIIFFLHLNNITMEKGVDIIYNNITSKENQSPNLLCKIRNKLYKTIYIMYLIDFPITIKNNTINLFLQLNKNMKYPFEINLKDDYFKTKCPFYFYFEKIIFKERIKNNFFDNFFGKSKDLEPPFSCDINIFEQAQLLLGFINTSKRKEQFELLQSLKEQIGFKKFSKLTDLFLMYLQIIFVDNYNTELIQELLTNYKNINFDIKPSFNFSLFFDSVIKPIFLKPFTERNFFIYNNFEYDLRNCLNTEYNIIFDKLCLKYFINYDKAFLMDENNLISRMKTKKQKNQFYELLYEIMSDLNSYTYCDFLIKDNYLSEVFIKDLFINKKKEINDIIQNKDKYEININEFNGLKFLDIDNYKVPFYCLGKLNNNDCVISIDDKELFIYDNILGVKVRVNYNFSKNTTSLFQMSNGNLIIVYSNRLKVCIIEVKNIYHKINQIYSLPNNYHYSIEDNVDNYEYILKAIEIQNKNIIVLSKKSISFYYNKALLNLKDTEYIPLYDYIKYSDIKQKNNIMNISLLEFNYNFIIYISGNFKDLNLQRCFITSVNIIFNKNKKIFEIEFSSNEIFGIELYKTVFEDNNILIKLSEDILGIGGKGIYLYTLKYKEIFQIVKIPSNNYIDINYYAKTVASFFLTKNQIIYVAVKYFRNTNDFTDYEIKFFIYCFLEKNELNDIKELVFLSEAKPNSQEPFFSAIEIQN